SRRGILGTGGRHWVSLKGAGPAPDPPRGGETPLDNSEAGRAPSTASLLYHAAGRSRKRSIAPCTIPGGTVRVLKQSCAKASFTLKASRTALHGALGCIASARCHNRCAGVGSELPLPALPPSPLPALA